jgi:DNA invertase Pin-like site-specific DNA recombinase
VRVAIYTRISTDEDRQPFSLGAQAERLEAYARSQDGWRIVRRFTDQASGATLDRPGLRRACRAQKPRIGPVTRSFLELFDLLRLRRLDGGSGLSSGETPVS